MMVNGLHGGARHRGVRRKGAWRKRALAASRRLPAWRPALIREELSKVLHARAILMLPLLALALNAALLFGHLWLRPMMVEVDAAARDSVTLVDD